VLTTQARFGNFAPRTDIDTIFFWTVQNLGVGNVALVRQARSLLQQANSSKLIVLNQVRRQVAQSYANSYASFAQIGTSEQALRTSLEGFRLDTERTFNKVGLPIETLDSLRLLADARYAYLDAIIGFNQAHFALYVALGSPPVDVLARAIPADLVPPPADAHVSPGPAPREPK
jgi:outer membrane protein TolC